MAALYPDFLADKAQLYGDHGIAPDFMAPGLFDFQKELVKWATLKGRGAIFADCGLGKTPIQLTWAENIVRKLNKRVLILTPLAVSAQTLREGEKFGIECHRSRDGKPAGNITITNYEKLHLFDAADFVAVVCDESSILKSFDGRRRLEITQFMRKMSYRLLCTATAAPNDHIELGTSSEALGYLGYMDMLNRFFRNENNNSALRRSYGEAPKWRFKGHAELPFWRWVVSWARACRKPSDLGCEDGPFILPPLVVNEHLVEANTLPDGCLFPMPAISLQEQREEKRRTINERCQRAADLVNDTGEPALVWCHLNDEGDLLEKMIPDAVQISGSNSDEIKEERFLAFANGDIRVLVTKPKIGAWGLNFQHCAHVVFFPSHSYEQYYQGVRRCWRFGQKRQVNVDIVLTEGERRVMKNLQRKSAAADQMFSNLVAEMNHATHIEGGAKFTKNERIPSWL